MSTEIHILLWQEKNTEWWGFCPETHIVYGEHRSWSGKSSEERKALLTEKIRNRIRECGASYPIGVTEFWREYVPEVWKP